MSENLLKDIKYKSHALNKLIKITEDNTSFISFENKEKKVYGGKVCLEELAREILMQTYLKNEQIFYKTEVKQSDEFRADLVAKIDEISSIIEVKQLNPIKSQFVDSEEKINEKKFEKLISDAFNQITIFYATDLKKDCFISVFVMDVEKVVQNPLLIDKYFNIDNNKKEQYSSFLEYGIYIETQRYSKQSNDYLNKSWPNLPQHGSFTIENDFLEIPKIFCQIKNAINLPTTSSNSYGIRNVRDIKDPITSAEKKQLIMNILETTIDAKKKNNPKLITNAGKDKDFLASKKESIFYTKEIISEDRTLLTISTLNGAIIDGQNSIDSFKWIIDAINNTINNSYTDDDKDSKIYKLEKQIVSKITESEIDLEDFKTFLSKSPLAINIEVTEDNNTARDQARSKNHTMKVTESELALSSIQIHIQVLANALLDKHNIELKYPKKNNFTQTNKLKDISIEIEELVKYLECLESLMKQKAVSNKELFKQTQVLSSPTKRESYTLIKDQYIDESKKNNPEKEKVDKEIENLNKMISLQEKFYKSLEEDSEQNPDNELKLKKSEKEKLEYDNLCIELKELQEKSNKLKELVYDIKNLEQLYKIIKSINNITTTVNEEMSKLPPQELKLLKKYISKPEKVAHFIFVLWVTTINKIEIISKSEAKIKFEKLKSNILQIYETYGISITTLRNEKNDNTEWLNKKTNNMTNLGAIRNEFFKI